MASNQSGVSSLIIFTAIFAGIQIFSLIPLKVDARFWGKSLPLTAQSIDSKQQRKLENMLMDPYKFTDALCEKIIRSLLEPGSVSSEPLEILTPMRWGWYSHSTLLFVKELEQLVQVHISSEIVYKNEEKKVMSWERISLKPPPIYIIVYESHKNTFTDQLKVHIKDFVEDRHIILNFDAAFMSKYESVDLVDVALPPLRIDPKASRMYDKYQLLPLSPELQSKINKLSSSKTPSVKDLLRSFSETGDESINHLKDLGFNVFMYSTLHITKRDERVSCAYSAIFLHKEGPSVDSPMLKITSPNRIIMKEIASKNIKLLGNLLEEFQKGKSLQVGFRIAYVPKTNLIVAAPARISKHDVRRKGMGSFSFDESLQSMLNKVND